MIMCAIVCKKFIFIIGVLVQLIQMYILFTKATTLNYSIHSLLYLSFEKIDVFFQCCRCPQLEGGEGVLGFYRSSVAASLVCFRS